MRYLILLLLVSCAAPLTEEEQFQREYDESDRKILYELWEKACLNTKGTVFANKPSRQCRVRDCIPHRWDWDWDKEKERPKLGNSVQCISRRQVEEMMRGL